MAESLKSGPGARRERDALLDIIKGFSILWIIVIHTVWYSGSGYVPLMVRQLSLLIDVPLLFFLSGWGAAYQQRGVRFFGRRLFHLYLPYCVMILFLFLVCRYYSSISVAPKQLVEWFYLDFSHTPAQWECVLRGSMWYLQVFIIVYLTTPLLQKIHMNKSAGIVLISILFVCALYVGTSENRLLNTVVAFRFVTIKYIVFYLFFYALGLQLSRSGLHLKGFLICFFVLAASIGYIFYAKGYSIDIQASKFPPSYPYLLLSLFSVSAVMLIKTYADGITTVWAAHFPGRFLRRCGEGILHIYLYQGFGAMLIYPLAGRLTGHVPWLVVFTVCLSANMSISLTLAAVFSRINASFLKYVDRFFSVVYEGIRQMAGTLKGGEVRNDMFNLFAIGLGGGIIFLAFAVLILSSVLFWFSVPITPYHFAVGFMVSMVYIWLVWKKLSKGSWRRLIVLAGVYCAIITASIAIANSHYDLSYDGQAYHQAAVIHLVDGWNPVKDPPVKDTHAIWINHYPKGSWIIASSIYKMTHRIETGKAINILLVTAAFLLVFSVLNRIGLGFLSATVLSVLAALNPVSVYQALSYYVDGQLASLMTCFVAVSVLFFSPGTERATRILTAMLAVSCLVLMISLKFTGFIYSLMFAVATFLVFYDMKHKKSLALFACLAFFLGLCVVGYNPYINNALEKGHPFYPLFGQNKIDIMSYIYPANFVHMNRFEKLFHAVFSESAQVRAPRSSALKIPFTFSQTELLSFNKPDVEIGGLGPLFGAAVILSILLLFFVLLKLDTKNRNRFLVFLGVLIVTVFSNPEGWWARYAPQLWLVPLIISAASYYSSENKRLPLLLNALLVILLSANVAMVTLPYYISQRDRNVALRKQLYELATIRFPITVSFGPFQSSAVRMKERGIIFTEVNESKCKSPQLLLGSANKVSICKGESLCNYSFQPSWYNAETSGDSWLRWTMGEGTILVNIPKAADVVVSGEIISIHNEDRISVRVNGVPDKTWELYRKGWEFKPFEPITLHLREGDNIIIFSGQKGPIVQKADKRAISIALKNIRMSYGEELCPLVQ